MKPTASSARLIRQAVQPDLPKLALAILGLFLAGCESAPTASSAPAPATAAVANPVNAEANRSAAPATETNRTLPMLFIVGDSTVRNGTRGQMGWGTPIARFFDPAKIKVENLALGGRSSRTFQTQGWWDKVLAAARPGDFVLMQFGHNDGGPLDDTNRARGTIRGLGEETKEIYNPIMKKPEVVHTYGWYMRKYITDARAKGMTPIVCSPVPRLPKQPVQAGDVDTNSYVVLSAEVASSQNVLFIDLNHIILGHYAGMTPEEIKAKYFTPADNTHTSPVGADLNAQSVVEGLRALKDCPLKNFLLDQPAPFTPPPGAEPAETNDLKPQTP
jgi:lysophospholipase L1-like esterase